MTEETSVPFEPIDTTILEDIVDAFMFHPKLLEKANVPAHVEALKDCVQHATDIQQFTHVRDSRAALLEGLTGLSEELDLCDPTTRIFVHATYGVALLIRWDWLDSEMQERVNEMFSVGHTIRGPVQIKTQRVAPKDPSQDPDYASNVRHVAITYKDETVMVTSGFPTKQSAGWWALGMGIVSENNICGCATSQPTVPVYKYDSSDLKHHLDMGGSIEEFLRSYKVEGWDLPTGLSDGSDDTDTVNQSE